MIQRTVLLFCLVALLASLVACSHMRGDGPLKTITYPAPSEQSSPGLIVFLRGIGGSHHSFERSGWVEAVHERGLDYAMAAPNAHFGYYRERTLVPRLRDEVVAPAQAAGSDDLWLVGVSMGGLGSLFYLKEQPQDVHGVVLISPYLGNKKISEEISNAGGLQAWEPGELAEDDWQRGLWLWLKELSAETDGPPLILAFGSDDRYAASHQVLAAALPPDSVITTDGGHRNKVFTGLWKQVLERGFLDN